MHACIHTLERYIDLRTLSSDFKSSPSNRIDTVVYLLSIFITRIISKNMKAHQQAMPSPVILKPLIRNKKDGTSRRCTAGTTATSTKKFSPPTAPSSNPHPRVTASPLSSGCPHRSITSSTDDLSWTLLTPSPSNIRNDRCLNSYTLPTTTQTTTTSPVAKKKTLGGGTFDPVISTTPASIFFARWGGSFSLSSLKSVLFGKTDDDSVVLSEDEKEEETNSPGILLTEDEERVQYWKKRCFATTATTIRQQAQALYEYALALGQVKQYDKAIQIHWDAIELYKKNKNYLGVARSLEQIGTLRQRRRCSTRTMEAVDVLREAYNIRCTELGDPWHVDCLSTLAHLGNAYACRTNTLPLALEAYTQVYRGRRAVLGMQHPAVAVAAHELAKLYFKLNQWEEADHWFRIARETYELGHVPFTNPSVRRLNRDFDSFTKRKGEQLEQLL